MLGVVACVPYAGLHDSIAVFLHVASCILVTHLCIMATWVCVCCATKLSAVVFGMVGAC